MPFSSIVFLFSFLPVVLILYYVVPRPLKNVALLFGSLVFYAWGEPLYVVFLILSVVFNYFSGLNIAAHLGSRKRARRRLHVNVIVNVGVLVLFRYGSFLLGSVNSVFHLGISYKEFPISIGLSFYTLRVLSYIIDVYRKETKIQKNILDFAVYVTMFPYAFAGPAAQYTDIAAQLHTRKETWDHFGSGARLFICGLSKKILLADTIGMVFQEVSRLRADQVSVLSAWLGCAAYAFQIYFSFSGYSDMASGLGRMFGFEFKKNFSYPYASKSITEFWERWYTSLSAWFWNYVYVPLGGKKAGGGRYVRSILTVWILMGLWHGPAWNFAVWGLYYGVVLLGEYYLTSKAIKKLPSVLSHLYCTVLMLAGWVFFFSPTLKEALDYLGLMLGSGGRGLFDERGIYLLASNGWRWVILILGSTSVVHRVYEHIVYEGRRAKTAVDCIVHGVLFLLCLTYITAGSGNSFLYFWF